MKNMKKLWLIGLVLLPVLTLTTANLSALTDKKAGQANQVLLAANEEINAQPSAADETATQETKASVESEKKDSKIMFISGALVMGILLIVVLYKTKGIVKDED